MDSQLRQIKWLLVGLLICAIVIAFSLDPQLTLVILGGSLGLLIIIFGGYWLLTSIILAFQDVARFFRRRHRRP